MPDICISIANSSCSEVSARMIKLSRFFTAGVSLLAVAAMLIGCTGPAITPAPTAQVQ